MSNRGILYAFDVSDGGARWIRERTPDVFYH